MNLEFLLAEAEESGSGIDLLLPATSELVAGIAAFAIVFFFIWKCCQIQSFECHGLKRLKNSGIPGKPYSTLTLQNFKMKTVGLGTGHFCVLSLVWES